MACDDFMFDDELDQQLFQQVLKNEEILNALGPLNKNWFEDLNDQFNHQLFDESFDDDFAKDSNASSSKKIQESCPVIQKPITIQEESNSSLTNDESDDMESLAQAIKLEQQEEGHFIYPVRTPDAKQSHHATPRVASKFIAATNNAKCLSSPQTFSNVTCGKNNNPFRTPQIAKTPSTVPRCQAKQTSNLTRTSSSPFHVGRSIQGSKTCHKGISTIGVNSGFHTKLSKTPNVPVRLSATSCFNGKQTRRASSPTFGCGFTTASHKPLKYSNEALAKAKKLFVDASDETDQREGLGVKPLFQSHSNQNSDQSNTISCVGFKTASNKAMTVSSTSWKKAQTLIESVDEMEEPSTNLPPKSFQSTNMSLSGFKTASNKPMSVSANALKQAKESFANDEALTDNNNISFNMPNEAAKVASFPTLNNKPTASMTSSVKHQDFTNNDKIIHKNDTFLLQSSNPIYTPNKSPIEGKFSTSTNGNLDNTLLKSCSRGKRRNSFYKPPRKRSPLKEMSVNLPPAKKHASDEVTDSPTKFSNNLLHKRHLGMKPDQENQINISDESLLKAMAIFEQV